jgi:mRNA-degrading endonuclease RelE of RelBE toxin-antitoxin system
MANEMYTVHITNAVEEDLNEFDSYRARVIQEILTLESNPQAGHILKGKLKGLRSLEFSLPDGACRAIYKIKADKSICLIIIVGYHENIYDKAHRRVESLIKNGLL